MARASVFFYANIQNSTLFYVNVFYTHCAQYASAHGVSVYQTVRDLKYVRDPHRDPVEYAVEYPPLAVGWMILPGLFLPPITDTPRPDVVQAYIQGNRAAMALADLAGFLLLAATLPILIPRGPRDQRYEWRLLFYIAAGLLLMHILYDRFDLVVGVLILAALRLLAARVHYLWPFAVLAFAINFKLTPLVLAPVWIFGSLPAGLFAGLRWNAPPRRVWRRRWYRAPRSWRPLRWRCFFPSNGRPGRTRWRSSPITASAAWKSSRRGRGSR
jgi:hypothetical protein